LDVVGVIIRAAVPADAEALVALTREIVAEPLRTAPLDLDEVRSVDEVRAQLADGIVLVAVTAAGELLGTISLRCPSPRRAFAHTAVYERLRRLRVNRVSRQLDARTASKWTREYFVDLGLHRLRGTVKYPETVQYRWSESPPASRVREIREHGFHGGRTETHNEGK
jgi:hypothetical protein